jgi:hypothetical protein
LILKRLIWLDTTAPENNHRRFATNGIEVARLPSTTSLLELFETLFASITMESSNFQIRSSQAPSSEMDRHGSIAFMHPGYIPPEILFTLPKVDSTAMGKFGVHFGTAIIACQIVANNVFDTGYLTLDIEGQQRVSLHFDHVLTESQYYLHIHGCPDMTPIS